jgi:regulator of nonsense transcripts 3
MASTAPTRAPAAKPREKKEKKDKVAQPPSANERLKIVVRRLPPNLPEDIFWQSVQTWVSEDNVTFKAFYAGKIAKRFVFYFLD